MVEGFWIVAKVRFYNKWRTLRGDVERCREGKEQTDHLPKLLDSTFWRDQVFRGGDDSGEAAQKEKERQWSLV